MCLTQRFLFGLEPFSIEVNIHVEAELFLIAFPDSTLYLQDIYRRLPPSSLSIFLFFYVLLESSGIIYACGWLLLIMGTQHGHLRASLSRSDISNVSGKSGEYMVVSYTVFICSCPETSISQTHLYLS